MTEIKQFIEHYNAMLPVGTSISLTKAEKRAGSFLEAMARIVDWKHILTTEKIKLETIQIATRAVQMSKGTSKTMTENKLSAEASAEYIKAREEFDGIENDIGYLRDTHAIFMAAHVFYRNMAKGDNV